MAERVLEEPGSELSKRGVRLFLGEGAGRTGCEWVGRCVDCDVATKDVAPIF